MHATKRLNLLGAMAILACGSPPASPPSATEPSVPTAPALPPQVPLVPAPKVAVARNPYAGVDWQADLRLKTQLHDHAGTVEAYLRAYDLAGYDVVPIMNYSGVASMKGCWLERRWPPEKWLPAAILASPGHIKVWLPEAEEVGDFHVTSPFLTTYIAKWEPQYYPRREEWHYDDAQGAIDLIARYGGLPFLAHPWTRNVVQLSGFRGVRGTELYSAYVRAKWEAGDPAFPTDMNDVLLSNWDLLLAKDDRVLGVAVNDHFGPYNTDTSLSPRTRDSGKTLVLAKALTLEGLRDAFDRGALLAVTDLGIVKDRYPVVDSIIVSDKTISVFAAGSVEWKSAGRSIATGSVLQLNVLEPTLKYVRAEISGNDGSKVFTQAFGLRQIGQP